MVKVLYKQEHKSGFTLLELIVTMAIFGILAIVAIPELSKLIGRQKEYSSAVYISNILKQARKYAIVTRKSVTVSWTADNKIFTTNSSITGLISQNRIDSSFKSAFTGIRGGSAIQNISYTATGSPYVNGTLLTSSQKVVFIYSTSQSTVDINNSSNIGVLVASNGGVNICRNTIDGQTSITCTQ